MFFLYTDKILECVIDSQKSRGGGGGPRRDVTSDLHSSYQFSEEYEKAIRVNAEVC